MSHTKGLLHITAPDDALWARGVSDDTKTLVAFCGNDASDQARADARRLVAAWNACRHLTMEQLEAGDLDYAGCSTLADIRVALGVGDKPMLGELAGIVAQVTRERDEAVEALLKWQALFCDSDMRPEDECHECYDFADVVLAKIKGGQK